MIDINRMPEAIAYYCNGHPTDDPLVSPVFADLSGLAPLFVQVGTEEVLFDDATRLVERAEAAGTKAELQIWDDMPHVHQIAFRLVPEARAALKDIARFFKSSMA
jgi:acetyl esterase/lipase